MLFGETFELTNEIPMAAQLDRGIDALLHGAQIQLLESDRLCLQRGGLVAEIAKWSTSPHPGRFAEQLLGGCRIVT